MSRTRSLTLAELINIANDAYPDGFLANYFDPVTEQPKCGSGDTLAHFIVSELSETFDAGSSRLSQLAEARRALNNAVDSLEAVIEALR
jgi:hypothetical protein